MLRRIILWISVVLVGCTPLPRESSEPLLLSGDSPYTHALLSDLSKGITGKGYYLKCLSSPSQFGSFLNGKEQVFLSSRFIALDEARAGQIVFLEIPVALSGIVLVASGKNSFAHDITIEELRQLWRKGSALKTWRDVRTSWPNEAIRLYGPLRGTPSYHYFSEALFGEPDHLREDYREISEGAIAEVLHADALGMAFLTYPEYKAKESNLVPLAIESGRGSVLPTPESFANRTYTPFTMPVLLYIDASVMDADALRNLVQSVLSDSAGEHFAQRGFVPLPPVLAKLSWERYQKRVTGSLLDPPRKGPDKLRDFLTATHDSLVSTGLLDASSGEAAHKDKAH